MKIQVKTTKVRTWKGWAIVNRHNAALFDHRQPIYWTQQMARYERAERGLKGCAVVRVTITEAKGKRK